MRVKRLLFIPLFMLLFTLCMSLCSCEFVFDGEIGPEKVISGIVTFEGSPLSDVTIRSNNTVFATTNSLGQYSFTTKLENIEIYAEKNGYAFATRYTLTESMDNANFVATQIKDLNGQLKLSKIHITPTSISSFIDNNFNFGDKVPALKVAHIDVLIQDETLSLIDEPTLIQRYRKSSFETPDSPVINYTKDTLTQVKVRMQANFKLQLQEALASEEVWVTVNISNLTTKYQNEQGNVLLYVYGNNSAYNGYTYDLCLEFEYEEINTQS